MPSDQESPKTAESLWEVLNPPVIPRWRKLYRIAILLLIIRSTAGWTLKSSLIGSTIPESAVPALRTVRDFSWYGVILLSFVGCWMLGVAGMRWIWARLT